MQQRELTDSDGTTWTCVQAYTGVNGENTKKATELAETDHQEVPVVCTPRGGEQSVRINLDKDWMELMSDEDLLEKIRYQKKGN